MGFQSTQPSQAVTLSKALIEQEQNISIHTALAGCDSAGHMTFQNFYQFQSTQPSQAVTLTPEDVVVKIERFQSTQPSQAVTAIIPNINKIPTNIIIYNA